MVSETQINLNVKEIMKQSTNTESACLVEEKTSPVPQARKQS